MSAEPLLVHAQEVSYVHPTTLSVFSCISILTYDRKMLLLYNWFVPWSVCQHTVHHVPHRPSCLAYEPRQQLLAIGSKNGTVVMWAICDLCTVITDPMLLLTSHNPTMQTQSAGDEEAADPPWGGGGFEDGVWWRKSMSQLIVRSLSYCDVCACAGATGDAVFQWCDVCVGLHGHTPQDRV